MELDPCGNSSEPGDLRRIDVGYDRDIDGNQECLPKHDDFRAGELRLGGFCLSAKRSDANGRDFLSFYLQGMAQAGATAQKRLLDVLDLHWYPEATGDGIRITSDGDSPGLESARIQASRSLWDPTYVENSWITQSLGGNAINLIPGVFSRINSTIRERNSPLPNTTTAAATPSEEPLPRRTFLAYSVGWGCTKGPTGESAPVRQPRSPASMPFSTSTAQVPRSEISRWP